MGIFDMEHKNKCPLCGKNMDYIYGDMVCSECGYRASYSTTTTSSKSVSSTEIPKSSSSSTATQSQAAPPKITYSYTESTTTAANNRESSYKKYRKTKNNLYFVYGIVILILAVVIFCSSDSDKKNKRDVTQPTYDAEFLQDVQDMLDSYNDSSQSDYAMEHNFPELPDSDTNDESINGIYTPINTNLKDNSEGILEVGELIFEKETSDITALDLSSITYLDFFYYDYDYKVVAYEIASQDGTSSFGYVYPGDVSFYDTDFSVFPNLDTLYMDYGSIGSLQGLKKLCVLGTDMTTSEIEELINPEQLISLTLTELLFDSSLSNIGDFKNLTSLNLDSGYLENIDSLSKLKNLETLRIYDGNTINDFSVLYDMPQLEYLYLDCSKLRNIGFIENMPKLTDLHIWNSEVLEIDSIKNCKNTLKTLDLSYNYKVKNYDAVSELTNLESLSLYVDYSFDEPIPVPQLKNMPNLTRLLLGHFDDLSELKNATGLTSLTLYDTYASDFSSLESLQELTSLSLYDMSLEPSVFDSVMKLTNLTSISLDDSHVWGNVEELLTLPNLMEFYMSDCVAGFDVTNLTPNPSLLLIDLNHSQLRALKDGKWDYNDNSNILSLAKNTDIFKNYENLQELYISEHEIDSIQFAASLPHLRVLDITDNYVTDLTPLAILPNLECVLCYNNPIANDGGLGNKITK